jgi:predicted AlkP superfamily pyrophosphatase or phosphodiesterase
MRNGLVPLLLALGAGGLVAGGCRPAPGVPQNLILISIDTLRADHLGVYGYSRDTSPNLDRLARESTVFRQAVAQAPHTAPSHASLLTSLYYSVHQLSGEGDRLPAWRTTLAELLRDRGFATWAFVDGGKLRRAFGLDQGFDVYEDRTRGIEEILRDVERRLRTVNVPRATSSRPART